MDRLDPELRLDGRALLLDVLRLAEAVDQDVGAFLGHGAGDGQADSAGGAGDDGSLGFQDHRARSSGREEVWSLSRSRPGSTLTAPPGFGRTGLVLRRS